MRTAALGVLLFCLGLFLLGTHPESGIIKGARAQFGCGIGAPGAFTGCGSSSYIGPGDINPSALGWWGLRAYSAAKAGTKAINVIRNSDNATMDINTLANGKLDIATLTTFLTSTTGSVLIAYDQSGNGNDLTHIGGGSNGLIITLTALNGYPTMGDSSTVAKELAGTISSVHADPITSSIVYQNTQATAWGGDDIFRANGDRSLQLSGFSTNQINQGEGGSFVNATAADGSWHSVQAAYTGGAASSVKVDGSTTSGSLSAVNAATSVHIGPGQIRTWSFMEGGFWAGTITDLTTNQRSYYGF